MRNRRRSFAVIVTALAVATGGLLSAHVGGHASPADRQVCRTGDLFCDDFSGTALDTSRWSPNWYGGSGPVNGAESACYDPSHVTEHGGVLDLKLTETPSSCKGANRPETTGIASTLGHFTTPATNYRIIVRTYVPGSSAGTIYNWPAVWTDGTGSWPSTGESDVMEGLSGHACYHYHSPSGGPGGCPSGNYVGWHTFREDVVGGTVTYRYDGTIVGTETAVQAPQIVVLGNQGAGSYGGPSQPSDLLVRSVRVIALRPPTAPGVRTSARSAAPSRTTTCDGEHMAMVNGVYTTCATLQQGVLFENMDAWSPDSTLQQTMDVTSNSHWDATVTETDSSNPRVITYPDSERRFTQYDGTCNFEQAWSAYAHLSSTWALSAPTVGDYDESYDLWLGTFGGCKQVGVPQIELMTYTKWHGNVFAPTAMANFTTFDGQNYDAWWAFNDKGVGGCSAPAGCLYLQTRLTSQATSGTVHLGQLMQKLNANGYTYYDPALGTNKPIMPSSADLADAQYGVEVVSGTNTASAGSIPFHLTDFSVTAN